MKPLLLFLCLLFSPCVFSQEHALSITDSLIPINNVKSRLRAIPGSQYASQYKEEFNKDGRIKRGTLYHPFTLSSIIETDYFYDSLNRLYASRSVNTAMWYSTNHLKDAYGNEVSQLTSYYQYDNKNRLIRIYIPDSAGKISYESFHSYNPKVVDKRWYNQSGMWKQAIDSFERNNFVTSMHIMTFSLGRQILTDDKYLYQNSFDQSGKLVKTIYQSERCASVISYQYLDNGLIKKKTGDNCHHTWQYSYKYFK